MRRSEFDLHDALRAVILVHVPRVANTARQSEHRLVRLLGQRARQLQARGLSREEIVQRLLMELAGPEPADLPDWPCVREAII